MTTQNEIKALATAFGSQAALARAMGVRVLTINRWCNGKTLPRRGLYAMKAQRFVRRYLKRESSIADEPRLKDYIPRVTGEPKGDREPNNQTVEGNNESSQ